MEARLYEDGCKINRWIVLNNDNGYTGKNRKLICRCECGTVKSVYQHKIQNGTSKSCGCLSLELKRRFAYNQIVGNYIVREYVTNSRWKVECIFCFSITTQRGDKVGSKRCSCQIPPKQNKKPKQRISTFVYNMVGEIYGKLKVVNFVIVKTDKGNTYRTWNCQCECGNYKSVTRAKLLSGKYTCCGCSKIQKSFSWTNEEFIEQCKDRVNFEMFVYTRCNYIDADVKVELGCNKCNNFWFVKPRHHLSGKGCPFCKSSGFKANLPGILYVLKHDNIYKIGITNKSGLKRATKINSSSGKSFEVVKEYSFNKGSDALYCEGILKKKLQSLYDSPTDAYEGYTESFIDADVNILLELTNDIINGRLAESGLSQHS